MSHLLPTGVTSTVLLRQKQVALKDGVTLREVGEMDMPLCQSVKAWFCWSVPQVPHTRPLLCSDLIEAVWQSRQRV